MRAVAARLRAEWDDDGAPFRDSRDLALEDAQLRRIDQIVGGVDRQQRRANLFQVRSRVIVVRRLDLIEDVICVG